MNKIYRVRKNNLNELNDMNGVYISAKNRSHAKKILLERYSGLDMSEYKISFVRPTIDRYCGFIMKEVW